MGRTGTGARLRGAWLRCVFAATAAFMGAAVFVVAAGASGRSSTAVCSNQSTACLDSVAMSYVGAIGSKNPALGDAVRAAASVQRWENGLHNVSSRAQLVAEIKNTQRLVADIRDVRLFAARNGRDVFAMYLADAGPSRQLSITAHVIERIGISHGLIDQIEVVQCTGGPGETSMGSTTDLTGTLDLALCMRGNPAVPTQLLP